jgi:hypothetical protein
MISSDPIQATLTRLEAKLNAILDTLAAVHAHHDMTRSHLVFAMQDSLTLAQRITALEEEMQRR